MSPLITIIYLCYGVSIIRGKKFEMVNEWFPKRVVEVSSNVLKDCPRLSYDNYMYFAGFYI